MASTLQRPVHLILDWDGTITCKDTLAVLAELPKARDDRLQRSGKPPMDSSVRNAKWQDIVDGYMQDYTAHKAAHFPESGGPRELEAWLDSLEPIEYASAQRASKSGFFKGVNTEDIITTANQALESGTLEFRDGWARLFSLAFQPKCQVTIVSVNWSETFIRWSLYLAASKTQDLAIDKSRLETYINDMTIYANEIHGLTSPHGSSGRLVGSVRTAREKLAFMKKAVAAHAPSIELESAPAVIYVGDSATDYLCLKRASGSGRGCDKGVWIFDGPEEDVETMMDKTFAPCKVGDLDFVIAKDLDEINEIVLKACGEK